MPVSTRAKLTEELANLAKIGEKSLALDLASGNGSTTILLSKRFGCRIVGIDLSKEKVRKAKLRAKEEGLSGKVTFKWGDAEKLTFNDNIFDVIISECSLCLFPTKRQALSEAYRVLKPGGIVAISDITIKGTPRELQDVVAFAGCKAGAESLKELGRKLDEAGFQEIITFDKSEVIWELYGKYKGRSTSLKELGETISSLFDDSSSNWLQKLARSLERLITQGKLGYGIALGTKHPLSRMPIHKST